jgi:lipopolysaccharide transport protein LptA
MTWQKKARLAIAIFVVAFVAMVALALRRSQPEPRTPEAPHRADDKTIVETHGGIQIERWSEDRRLLFSIRSQSQLVYPDGRQVQKDVTLTLPDRGGRTIVVTANEAEATIKEGEDLSTALLKGDVRMKTSDGVEVAAPEATYTGADSVLKIPGPVTFSKGRMKGSGVGATYDQNREVLWLLDQARIAVEPDAKGEGAVDAQAGAAGLARADHYIQLTRGGRIESGGRVMEADDITVRLTADDERVESIQLRVNSRITGASAGMHAMSARDIDLTYGPDGRTLQHAHLVDNAAVQLPGAGGAAGQRVSARTIDLTMSPDGATLTALAADQNVQLDLPPEQGGPARRIRSARLESAGSGAGLQAATFTGGVELRETRAARGTLAAIDRTARSRRLIVATAPGLGAIQQADFRGDVEIVDAPDVTARAPRIVHRVAEDRLDLSPGEGEPGPEPQVSDSRVTVRARTIELTLSTRTMKADTDVRSTLKPRPRTPADAAPGRDRQLPAVLQEDEPVNVTANRLGYDGAASVATYTGDATLWQGETKIQAPTITLDDRKGNLTGAGGVRTLMPMTEVHPKTKQRKTTLTSGKAETFAYDDAKRLATYTTGAVIDGAAGTVSADRIELFLLASGNELERAEGYDNVTVKEGVRTAKGTRLTYTAKDDRYVMTGRIGAPVEVIDDKPGECTRTIGSRLTFRRADDHLQMEGPVTQEACR